MTLYGCECLLLRVTYHSLVDPLMATKVEEAGSILQLNMSIIQGEGIRGSQRDGGDVAEAAAQIQPVGQACKSREFMIQTANAILLLTAHQLTHWTCIIWRIVVNDPTLRSRTFISGSLST